ncbi:hypothetical protein ABR763_01160 [Bacillus cereus]
MKKLKSKCPKCNEEVMKIEDLTFYVNSDCEFALKVVEGGKK